MAEQGELNEQDLSKSMKEKESKEKLLEKIKSIQDRIRLERGNESIKVKYYENCELKLGKNVIKVSVTEIEETFNKSDSKSKNEKAEDNQKTKTYEIYMKYKGQDLVIAKIDKDGQLTLNEVNLQKIDPKNKLQLKKEDKTNLDDLKKFEGKTEEGLSEELKEENKSKEEQVKEQIAKREGIEKDKVTGLVEIDLNRKITKLEAFKQLVPNIDKYTNVYVVPRQRFYRIYNRRFNKRW